MRIRIIYEKHPGRLLWKGHGLLTGQEKEIRTASERRSRRTGYGQLRKPEK
jgi:hypothetical protein